MDLTVADMVLLALLLVALPARQMRASLRARTGPKRPRLTRYLATLRDLALLLCGLTAIWIVERRTPAALGLDMPPALPGLIGLAVAALVIAVFVIWTVRAKPRPLPAGFEGADMFPETRSERRVFAVMALALGAGWELLYRGYLLWALTPVTGQIAAIALAATAYGLAHGYKSNIQLGGSLAMALACTIAYALTGSLWWLILIHIALPLIAWLSYLRMTRAEV